MCGQLVYFEILTRIARFCLIPLDAFRIWRLNDAVFELMKWAMNNWTYVTLVCINWSLQIQFLSNFELEKSHCDIVKSAPDK